MGESVAERDAVNMGAPAMRTGALAMIDALGFKGIWRSDSAAQSGEQRAREVIARLRALEAGAVAQAIVKQRDYDEVERETGIRLETKTSFLSDTIVVGGSWTGEPRGYAAHTADWIALLAVAQVVSAILVVAAESPIPIAYRGVITWGRFILDERFIIGPAVDEAGTALDLAEAAIVWLAPSAKRVLVPRIY